MKLLKFTVASLAMALVTLGAYAQTPQEAAEAYTAAGEKIKEKNYVEAIPLLESAVEIGEAAGDEASEIVHEAKKILPGMYYRAGGTLAQGGKLNEALPYIEKAVTLAEKYEDMRTLGQAKNMVAQIYINMGGTAFNEKDYKTAAEIFQKGYDVNPDNPQLSLFLAQSYAEMKEYEKAYGAFRGVIALEQHGEKYKAQVADAKEKMAYYMLINANDIASAQPAQAIEILSESVEIVSDPQAYMLLLQTANNSKNFNKVIEFGDKAAEAQTDAALKSTAYFFMGAAYDNKGDQTKAIENYRKVTAGPNVAAAKAQITAIQAAQS